MRRVSLLAVLVLAACGGNDDTELASGGIRALANLPSANVAGFDASVDLTGGRDSFVIAGIQNGEADYGRGTLGYADGRSQLVVGRYDTQFQALWLGTFDGELGTARPLVATQPLGITAVTLSDFTDDIALGGAPLASPAVVAFSAADGSVRWSVSAANAGYTSRSAALVIDSVGDVVLAHNTDETPGRVLIDRFSAVGGTLLASRPLGLGTGNARLVGMTHDLDNNLIVVVRFDGTVTLDRSYTAAAGQFAGYVAKIGRDSGSALWSRPIRLRTADERVAVGVLTNGDVTLSGPFALTDDTTDTSDPVSVIRYLRTSLLANASGASLWSTRHDLVNAASFDIVDASDFATEPHLVANFNGALTIGNLTASTTTASSMAVIRFSGEDGTPLWLNMSQGSAARGTRIGVLAGGDALALGTFTATGGSNSAIFAIQIVE